MKKISDPFIGMIVCCVIAEWTIVLGILPFVILKACYVYLMG